jgi:diguanylate cyclase (GGDEF)-like protein
VAVNGEVGGETSILAALKKAGESLGPSTSAEDAINVALEELGKAMGVDCWLQAVDAQGKPDNIIAHYGLSSKIAERITSEKTCEGLLSLAITNGKPLIVSNLSSESRTRALYQCGYASAIVLPIIQDSKSLAALILASATASRFTSSDAEALSGFVSYLGALLQRLTVERRSKEREEVLTLVSRLTRIICSSMDLDEVYESFAEELRKVMDVDWATIVLIEGDQLRFYALSSKIDSVWQTGDTLPLAGTATAYVAETREALVEPDLEQERRFWTGRYHLERGIRSIVYVPLIAKGEAFGALIVASRRPYAYGERELELLGHVAGQIAFPIQNARLYMETEEKRRLLAAIAGVTRVVMSDVNLDNVFDAFIEELRKLVSFHRVTITIAEGDRVKLVAAFPDRPSGWQGRRWYPLDASVTGVLAREKRTLVLDNGLAQSLGNIHEADSSYPSSIHVPLMVRGEVFGSLSLYSREPHTYGDKEREILEQLGAQIAGAIWSAQLYAKVEERARRDELTGLYNRRYFEECFEREIERHSRYGGNLSVIMLDLDSFKTYNDVYGHSLGDKVLGQIGQIIVRSIRKVDLAFRYGGDEFTVLLPQTGYQQAFTVAERLRRRILTRMRRKQVELTASLGVATWPGDGATAEELRNAADQALYYAKRSGGNRTQLASRTLFPLDDVWAMGGVSAEKGVLGIIYALAAAIEAKDVHTQGHSRRVRDYAIALAEAVGLTPDRVANLGAAALLHDIGKIGIPDHILNKTGKLTAEEWEVIQGHPKLATIIVGRIPALSPCLPAILHHHERWDGTGYPSGLKGDAIPLEARILAIADAFEAMTAPRPYRRALSIEAAVAELRRSAGGQFDPQLVEVFLSVLPQIRKGAEIQR